LHGAAAEEEEDDDDDDDDDIEYGSDAADADSEAEAAPRKPSVKEARVKTNKVRAAHAPPFLPPDADVSRPTEKGDELLCRGKREGQEPGEGGTHALVAGGETAPIDVVCTLCTCLCRLCTIFFGAYFYHQKHDMHALNAWIDGRIGRAPRSSSFLHIHYLPSRDPS
jgi:hypothetical protein